LRPVNLVPADQRSGGRAATRTGSLPYVIVGLLVMVVLAVVAVVLTENDVSHARADAQGLRAERDTLNAEAAELAPYTNFGAIAGSRQVTVESLARSRFDWTRVLQELSLVLPKDVWLVNLTATVGPGVSLPGAANIGDRSSVDAPALQMVGCAASQPLVAEFLASLENIDGITRVGLVSSQLRDSAVEGPATSAQGDDCRTRGFIWRFEVLATFDRVAAPPGSDTPPAVPPAETAAPAGEAATTGSDDGSADPDAAGDGGTGGDGTGNGTADDGSSGSSGGNGNGNGGTAGNGSGNSDGSGGNDGSGNGGSGGGSGR